MIILLNEKYLDDYYNLIKQLVSDINYDKKKLFDYFKNNNKKIYLLVKDNKIVGTGSLLIEKKIYHNFRNVSHIEDIVIDSNYRGKKYGKELINNLIDISYNDFNCYKVILNCSNKNIKFYEKCGFSNKNVEMVKYDKIE